MLTVHRSIDREEFPAFVVSMKLEEQLTFIDWSIKCHKQAFSLKVASYDHLFLSKTLKDM